MIRRILVVKRLRKRLLLWPKSSLLWVGIALLSAIPTACNGSTIEVPGATSVVVFEGECILITTSGQPAYTQPGPDKIPVGVSLPGEEAVTMSATFPDDSLWYLKADSIWFKATGADYETRGDCAA